MITELLDKMDWTPLSDPTEGHNADGLPYATHEGYLKLGGVNIHVFQLSDGRRIIPAEELARVLGGMEGEEE